MIKTIPKNRKQYIQNLLDKAVDMTAYSLNNSFSGKPLNNDCYYRNKHGEVVKASPREFLYNELMTFHFAKLRQMGEEGAYKKYHIDIHSNLWYEFFVKEEE